MGQCGVFVFLPPFTLAATTSGAPKVLPKSLETFRWNLKQKGIFSFYKLVNYTCLVTLPRGKNTMKKRKRKRKSLLFLTFGVNLRRK